MRSLPIDHVLLEDPLYTQRNPHQAFLLGLSVIASLPLLRGESGSTLLDAQLNDVAVALWGGCLLVGSVTALLGEYWPGRTWTGLVIERTGLGLVGGAAAIYAGVAWSSVAGLAATGGLLPWAGWCAVGSASVVAVFNAYRTPRLEPRRVAIRAALGFTVGLIIGGYAGMVWRTDADDSGVTYVVSIQVAYALSCLWRCVQTTARLRFLRSLRARLAETQRAAALRAEVEGEGA